MIAQLTRTAALGLVLVSGFVCTSRSAEPTKLIFRETALNALGRVPVKDNSVKINEAGTLAACLVEHNGQMFASINGQEGPAFDWIGLIGLGLDGQHVEYKGNRGGTKPKYWGLGTYSPIEGGQWFKVTEHQDPIPIDVYDNIGRQSVSQDVDRAATTNGKKIAMVDRTPNNESLNINGVATKHYNTYYYPTFSPNGERLAYEASIQNKDHYKPNTFVVVDGKRGAYYNGVHRWTEENWLDGWKHGSTLCFSPDSKHIAYAAYQYEDRDYDRVDHVVLDGQDEPRQKRQRLETPYPVFSADSNWLAYGESKDYITCSIVLRSVEGVTKYQSRDYDMVWLPRNQSSGIIHFFALHDQKIFRVEVVATDQSEG